jgi:hypothetical protein
MWTSIHLLLVHIYESLYLFLLLSITFRFQVSKRTEENDWWAVVHSPNLYTAEIDHTLCIQYTILSIPSIQGKHIKNRKIHGEYSNTW